MRKREKQTKRILAFAVGFVGFAFFIHFAYSPPKVEPKIPETAEIIEPPKRVAQKRAHKRKPANKYTSRVRRAAPPVKRYTPPKPLPVSEYQENIPINDGMEEESQPTKFTFNADEIDQLIEDMQDNPVDLEELLKELDNKILELDQNSEAMEPLLRNLEEKALQALENISAKNTLPLGNEEEIIESELQEDEFSVPTGNFSLEGRIFNTEDNELLKDCYVSYGRQISRSDEDGNYRLMDLPSGNITLTISKKGFLRKIHTIAMDPQSNPMQSLDIYLTPSNEANSKTHELDGIGVTLLKTPDGFRIEEVSPEGPAFEEGINAGDFIEAVDGKNIKNKSLPNVIRMIRGPKYTEVELTIRKDDESREEVILTRDHVLF